MQSTRSLAASKVGIRLKRVGFPKPVGTPSDLDARRCHPSVWAAGHRIPSI